MNPSLSALADRPDSRGSAGAGRAHARAGAIGGVGAFLAFLAVLLDGHRTLLRRAAITTDFYDVQAHSLLGLH